MGPAIDPTVFRTRPRRPNHLTKSSRQLLRSLRLVNRRTGRLSPLTYNLTVSHTHRFMWFRVAKVGTRSIFQYFADNQVTVEMLNASATRFPTTAFADYYKFGFVRDPLDRFISAWQNKVCDLNYFEFDPATLERMRTIEHFAAWVADQDLRNLRTTDRHIALQSRLLDLSSLNYLGRLETFDRDFGEICRELELPTAQLGHRNASRSASVTRENVSAELRAIVESKYRLDYQIFGY